MSERRKLWERYAEAPHLFDPDVAALVRSTKPDPKDAGATAPALERPSVSNPTNRLVPTVFATDDTRSGGGRVVENHLGLVGPVSALPAGYTHEAIAERKRRSSSLTSFLELFAAPFREMFVDAHRKYRLPSLFQLYRSGERNRIAHAVFAFMGFGTQRQRDALRIDPEIPLRYAGYFANQRRPAISLERMLADFLGLSVQVQQFQARRLEIAEDERSRLSEEMGANAILGQTAVAGATYLDRRGAIRIRIGPVDYMRYLSLMPDAGLYGQIVELVRLYVGPSVAFDLQIVLKAEDVPQGRLARGSPVGRLGWDLWVLSGPAASDSEETVFDPDRVPA